MNPLDRITEGRDLTDANLTNTDLTDAYLTNTDLTYALSKQDQQEEEEYQ